MAKEAKIDYDEENDIAYIYTGQNTSDSVDFDNFVIDFSKDGMIVGVEIKKAAEFAKKFGLTREFLKQSQHARMSIIQGREYALIRVLVFSAAGTGEIMVPSPVPQLVGA